MKREKIKYYNPELAWQENKLKSSIFVLFVFIIGFLIGYMSKGIERELKEKKLKATNYDQYVQIQSLTETIDRYERGDF